VSAYAQLLVDHRGLPMLMNTQLPWPRLISGSRASRMMLLLVITILTLKLCSLGFHHHALNGKVDDCASCQLAAADLPPLPMLLRAGMQTSVIFLLRFILSEPTYFFAAVLSLYLGPIRKRRRACTCIANSITPPPRSSPISERTGFAFLGI